MRMRVQAFRDLPGQVKDATKSIDEMTSSIYRSAQRWRTFGYLASITLTAPIVLVGKKSIETASDFEYSMNKIVGLVGIGRDKVQGFKKEILNMSLATGQTATKLGESMYYITSAGFKEGADAMRILEVAARGSTAGLGDMVDISKLLVFSMNAYKKSGYSATNVADIFTAAVREGALEAGDFAGAIQSVIPIASSMGVSLEQVAGSMAAMSLQGASAQNAAVYLKGMLNALLKIKPGGMAEKALKKFGVTAEDLYAELAKPNGLMNVLMKLQELSKKTTGNQFLKEIFRDIRAMTGELSLTGENLEYNQFVMDAVAKAGGDLARADEAVANGMDKMRKVIASLGEVIRIKLGDDLAKIVLPAFKSLLETIKDLVNAFDRMSDGAKKFTVHVIGLVAALGPLALFGSLLKYAYGGFLSSFYRGFIVARNVVGALNGDLMKMNKLMKNAPKWAERAKKFNIWRLEGGLGNLINGLKSLPLAAVTVAVGAGAVALFRYSKQVKEAAQAAREFNKAQVLVNGSVKAFNEMDKSDIEQMSLDEMMLARSSALQVWADSYKRYQQYRKNLYGEHYDEDMANLKDYQNQLRELDKTIKDKKLRPNGATPEDIANIQKLNGAIYNTKLAIENAETAGSKRLNKKYMQEEADAVEFAKKQYDDLTLSMLEMQKRLVADRSRAKRVADLKKTKEETEAIQKVMQEMYDDLAQVDEKAKAMASLQKPFDIAEEKARILLDTIDKLTGGDIKLHFEDKEVQTVMEMLKKMGIDFTKIDEQAENFAADLARIDMKKMLLGDEFDANTAKLQIYQKALDQIADTVVDPRLRPEGATLEDIKLINQYVKGIHDSQNAIEQMDDVKLMNFLNAQAQAFGGMNNQLEVLNAELQIAEREMRKAGEKGFTDEFKRKADAVNSLREATLRLRREMEIYAAEQAQKYIGFFGDTETLFSTKISAMRQEFNDWVTSMKAAPEVLKELGDQIRTLEGAKYIADMLSGAFNQLFDAIIEGGKNMSEVLIDIVKGLISQLMAELSRMLIMKLILAIATRGMSITMGGGGFVDSPIPITPGFTPNPVAANPFGNNMLAVASKSLSGANGLSFKNSKALEGDVVFHIGMDELTGILKKANKKNGIF